MKPAHAGMAIQFGAGLLALGVVAAAGLPWARWAPIQVVLAIAMCRMARQQSWWYLIHAGFAPMLMIALPWGLPPWWYLAALLLALAMFGRVDLSRVPLYLSNDAALSALDSIVPADAKVLDAGAGTGSVLARLARHGCRHLTGVEHAWLPWLIGRCRARMTGLAVTLVRADLMSWPLGEYDVVYAFLSPAAMPALWDKAKREMRVGSVLVSNSFAIPDARADQVIELNDWKGAKLYIWRMA